MPGAIPLEKAHYMWPVYGLNDSQGLGESGWRCHCRSDKSLLSFGGWVLGNRTERVGFGLHESSLAEWQVTNHSVTPLVELHLACSREYYHYVTDFLDYTASVFVTLVMPITCWNLVCSFFCSS